ncbi:MAG: leucine-rich repeat domain-containing protein [bacterium]|nr:leucine-rich repeat domain-containing protein [bacterium]
MKNILTVIVAATAFFNINAETLTLTPGSISAEIAADAAPAELIIKGEIDIHDFDYIRDNFWRTLRTLDLSEARIAAYEGEPTLTGVSKSEADVLPDGALMLGSLTEVTLPATLKAIGDGALASTAVKEIVIPATVEKIGTSAFANCNSLERVVLPSAVKAVGANAFADCGALKSADISAAAIEAVPADAFARCAALADVTLPSVAEIGASAFAGCKALTAMEFPKSLKKIDEKAFYGSGLAAADLAGCPALGEIGAWSFAVCGDLTSATFPESLKELGTGAFYSASALTLGELPPVARLSDLSLAAIGGTADASLTLPEGIEIGDYAMSGWKGVQLLTLPETTGRIGTEAMAGWTDLATIDGLNAVEVPLLGEEVWKGIDPSEVLLRVYDTKADDFKAADQWKDFRFDVVTGVDDAAADGAGRLRAWFEGMTLNVEAPLEIAAMEIYDVEGRRYSFPTVASEPTRRAVDTSAWGVRVLLVRVQLADGSAAALKLAR